jgi:hypothetical protein
MGLSPVGGAFTSTTSADTFEDAFIQRIEEADGAVQQQDSALEAA